MFNSIIVKKFYKDSEFLGDDLKNSKLRKLNIFKFYSNFLIAGYLINSLWFAYINDKLEFYFFDESKKL